MEKYINHPLEDVFGLEKGTTIIHQHESPMPTLVVDESYDDKDIEIENQYQAVYETAMAAFAVQSELIERGLDPRYSHNTLEVANKFLMTALEAAKWKSELKKHKDKMSHSHPRTTNVTNNNLIMDRNDLLKLLKENEKK